MKIAVRLDDIAPDMDWKRFLKFKELLDCYQIKPLIGVIPDNRDGSIQGIHKREDVSGSNDIRKQVTTDFWSYIKELQDEGWCIAMHGYQHVYSTKKGGMFPLNHFSEFAGKSYEEQLSMLKKGKELLEEKGIFTDMFMAPAHSYDGNTLKALREAGFQAVTDGFGGAPYRWKGLTFYPISFRLSSTLKKKSGYSTMVVHTGTVSEDELGRYEEYFKRQGVNWVDYSEYLNQPFVKQGLTGRCLEWVLAEGKHILNGFR